MGEPRKAVKTKGESTKWSTEKEVPRSNVQDIQGGPGKYWLQARRNGERRENADEENRKETNTFNDMANSIEDYANGGMGGVFLTQKSRG